MKFWIEKDVKGYSETWFAILRWPLGVEGATNRATRWSYSKSSGIYNTGRRHLQWCTHTGRSVGVTIDPRKVA